MKNGITTRLERTGERSWWGCQGYRQPLNRNVMPLDSLDNLPRSAEQVTLAEAYRAMLCLLEYYHRMGTDYEVGAILGDLSTDIWADGSPSDPAAWSLWLDSVDGKIHGEATGV